MRSILGALLSAQLAIGQDFVGKANLAVACPELAAQCTTALSSTLDYDCILKADISKIQDETGLCRGALRAFFVHSRDIGRQRQRSPVEENRHGSREKNATTGDAAHWGSKLNRTRDDASLTRREADWKSQGQHPRGDRSGNGRPWSRENENATRGRHEDGENATRGRHEGENATRWGNKLNRTRGHDNERGPPSRREADWQQGGQRFPRGHQGKDGDEHDQEGDATRWGNKFNRTRDHDNERGPPGRHQKNDEHDQDGNATRWGNKLNKTRDHDNERGPPGRPARRESATRREADWQQGGQRFPRGRQEKGGDEHDQEGDATRWGNKLNRTRDHDNERGPPNRPARRENATRREADWNNRASVFRRGPRNTTKSRPLTTEEGRTPRPNRGKNATRREADWRNPMNTTRGRNEERKAFGMERRNKEQEHREREHDGKGKSGHADQGEESAAKFHPSHLNATWGVGNRSSWKDRVGDWKQNSNSTRRDSWFGKFAQKVRGATRPARGDSNGKAASVPPVEVEAPVASPVSDLAQDAA